MPASVTIDMQELERRAQRAFRQTVQALEADLPAAHGAVVWGWQGRTQRQNGQVAGSPRNVVDTGELRDSQQPAQYPSALHARIAWNAEHAAAVYLGAVFHDRAASLPARNVPLYSIDRVNLPETFARFFGAT